MEWLSQNWIWLALFVGVLWLFSRGRHGGVMGGCGMHSMAQGGPARESEEQGADPLHVDVGEVASGQNTPRPAPSHRHRRGGCC